MFRLKVGFLHQKNLPSVEDTSRPGGIVDLQWWINLTQREPRLVELLHEDDRPTALFSLRDDRKFEVRYQFGFIIPQDLECADPAPIQELVDYMNHVREQPTTKRA